MSGTDETVQRWKTRSADYIRCVSDIWWDPCCPELVSAVYAGDKSRIRDALLTFGRTRRHQRFDLPEAIDDLYALQEVLTPEAAAVLDSFEVLRAVSEAWKEYSPPSSTSSTIDPLSRHPSLEYLLQRAEEFYEAERGTQTSGAPLSVLIARVQPAIDPLSRLTIRIRVGALTHELFAGWPRGMGDEGFVAIASPTVTEQAELELSMTPGVVVDTMALPHDLLGLQSLLTRAGFVL